MTVKFLSVFAEKMMPEFVHQDHIQFTKFIRYYFEYLEQENQVYDYASHSLEYMDIDLTKEGLLEEFRNTYLINFPEETGVDVRFLVKKIREFYKSKGSEKSYEFLFRLLYGDDEIDIYYPKLDILRCSDGKWVTDPSYTLGGYWENTDGFLSSDKKLQDNYYYQDFSYEIITDVTRFYYENVIKENVHVSGQLMFGRNILETDIPISIEWLDFDKYDRLKAQDLGLTLLWGGGYVVDQTEKNSESILIDVNGERVVESLEYPFLSITGSYLADDVVGIRRLDNALGNNETFIANGIQTVFNLDGAYTADQLMIWDGGVKKYEGVDWTVTGLNITFTTAPTVKVYVLKHTQESREVVSGIGTNKFITLTDDPQGYQLNKIIIFGNGIIIEPDWYDPSTKRVYFNDYVPEGTDNVEVVHMESLKYVDHVSIIDAITKYNVSTNKNEFKEHPTSPYVILIRPFDDITLTLTDSVTALWVFVTPTDDVTLTLIEKVALLINFLPTTIEINPAQTDELSLNGTDISFTFPSTIESTSTDLRLFSINNEITVTTTSGLNDGTYIIVAEPEENKIIVNLSSISGETDVEAGTTTITAVGTGYDYEYNGANDQYAKITTSVAKWGDVNHSDWAIVSGSGSSDGEYQIVSATPTVLTLYEGYNFFPEEFDDTVGTIQIMRDILQDRLYIAPSEGPGDPFGETINAAQVVARFSPIPFDDTTVLITDNTPSIFGTTVVADDIRVLTTEGAVSISGTTVASDNNTVLTTEGAPSILQTSSGTDVSYKANQTSGAQADIDFDTTTTLSSPTFDLTAFDDGDTITISGSTSNDGVYTISGAPTANALTIAETWTVEVPAAATTITTPAKIESGGVEDLSLFDANDVITTTSTSTTNDGTYNVHATSTPTATKIMVDETTITTEAAGTAGTVTISRTV